jgi:glycosyltransferase 2 family protein
VKSLSSYRKIIEFVALLLLAGLIIWLFGRKLDWHQVKVSVEKSDWRLILIAIVIILLAYLWRVVRWQALLKPLTPTSLREVWIATCVGFAAVLTIGRAGEVVRPVALPMRDRRVRPAASFVTIMIERLYDTVTVVLMFAINLLWFKPTSSAVEFGWVRIIGFSFLAVLFVGVAFLIWFRRRSAAFITWLDNRITTRSSLVLRIKKALLSTLEQLATALSVLSDVRLLGVTIFWSLVLWGSVVAANMLVCRAFGVSFGVSQIIFVLGWSMVGSVVPTPGGAAGAFHAATAAALILLGVGRDQAAAIAIILHLVDFGPAAVFGLFYFLRGDVNLARLRALVSTEAVEHAVEDEPVVVAEGA